MNVEYVNKFLVVIIGSKKRKQQLERYMETQISKRSGSSIIVTIF